ncbi:MAG: alpha/beta hydrolase [Ruminococcaceae bacterium]|nr:alpha/beta hydrolase [Oscillospiraceae bacterium]
MSKKKTLLKIGAAAGAVYAITGAAFTGFVLTRAHKHFSKFADKVKGNEPEPPADTSKTQEKADHIVIKNRSNKSIHGFMIKNPVESDKWAILIHGFNCEPFYMANLAEKYYEWGYNIIMPALRGHDHSEHNAVSMGWLDRLDMVDWINYLVKLYPECQILLHGISMGGATVMMTVGEDLPKNVKCAVEDCGYTSVWDEFKYELKKTYKLHAFPTLYASSNIHSVFKGHSLKKASSIEQLKKSKTPVLFIHGEEDDYVPFYMLQQNFDAAECEKDILVVPGAAHADSYKVNPELYWNKVEEFTNKYIK